MNLSTQRSCAQCGSKLILISSVTEKLPGTLFPQTTITFRCSDSECQERRDSEMEKRIQSRKEKAIADKQRLDERFHKRQREIQLKTSH